MFGDIFSGITSLVGGFLGRDAAQDNAARQAALQKEFAKSGIQWRVEDAKKAGVHPLYALGANTTSYTPQSVGDPLGGAIAEAGQSFGRAINSTMTADERGTSNVMRDLALERAKLQNDLLKMDILAAEKRLNNQPGSTTVMPGVVPQETGLEANPRVYIAGKEIAMDPNYSPGKVYEDAWSDLGIIPAAFKMRADIERTYGKSLPNLFWEWINEHADQLNRNMYSGSRKWMFNDGYDARTAPRSRRPAMDPRGHY